MGGGSKGTGTREVQGGKGWERGGEDIFGRRAEVFIIVAEAGIRRGTRIVMEGECFKMNERGESGEEGGEGGRCEKLNSESAEVVGAVKTWKEVWESGKGEGSKGGG